MTSMPADLLGIQNRGCIREGNFADLVIFDPETVADTATFTNLQSAPTGIDAVIVNGAIALQDGQVTCKTAGRLIQKT